ncbi:MAG TPA: circularly permuted type 2 ATP-grasp protein, partial [Pseudonocardia sp.]
DGAVQAGWTELAALLDNSSPARLAAFTRRLLADEGVTYRPPGGEDEQPWALDPLPLPLPGRAWAELEAGVAQRARLLDRLLADVYGPRSTLRSGVLPVEVVLGHAGYVHGWARPTPRSRELFLAATDLVRTPEGWRVLGDRVQAPSGAGYALANRRIVARVLAAVRRDTQIQRLGPFFDAMRRGLGQLAPATDRARVVLLTPGPASETAFEQALLASRLGFPLVLGSELTVREGRVWHTTMGGAGGLEPVDVILRRVDARWTDPLDLRQDSHLGVPGLLEAARLGTVAVVNGIGSGVAENPGLLPFLPALARSLLDEPLILAGARTWWCGDPASRSHVLAHLPELLVKPIARGEGRSTLDGATLTAAERAELAARIEAEPHAWTGQEPQRVSTAPVIGAGGALDARPLVLRTFAVAADGDFQVLAGGLAEAGARGDKVAKDVWVSGRGAPAAAPDVAPPGADTVDGLSPRVAADLFWLGRYAERAESTARLLRAVADRFADFRSSPEPAGGEALGVLLRAATAVTATPTGTPLHSLVADRQLPGTLAYAVHRLTAAAQAVREQLSTDMWLVLGRLESVLAEAASTGPDGGDVSGTLSQVLEGLLAVSGLAAESHVRDAGWHLSDAGRRLERAQHVAALVAATLDRPGLPAADGLVLESVLIAAESVITYRRRRRAGLDAVLELLITDPDNPRSISYQADRLRQDVAQVPGPDGGVLSALVALERRLAELRPADLATIGPDGTRVRLRRTLTGLSADLARFADVLEGARFAPGVPPRP